MPSVGGSRKSGDLTTLIGGETDPFAAFRSIYAAPKSQQKALIAKYREQQRERSSQAGQRAYDLAARIGPKFVEVIGKRR